MKVLLLGANTYPAHFFLEELDKSINVTTYSQKFIITDILNLDNRLFFDKYFSSISNNFDCSLNFVHIHDAKNCSTIDINKKLTEKLIFTFSKIGIKKNIYISSVNSFNKTVSEYGKAKLISEEIYKSINNSIIIRPSTIIDIDYKNKIINGGKKGKSLDNLNKLISKFFIVPVPGFGNYPQTVCFGIDLAKFLEKIIPIFKKIRRIKMYIPKILIIIFIKILNSLIPKLSISKENIDNLTNQKIEFNFSQDINKFINLKKIYNINKDI